MPLRYTVTEKWKDSWFLDLSCEAKATFEYLRDNCNLAGFIDRHDRSIENQVRVPKDKIEEVYKELSKSISIIGDKIWVKNHIRHQKNLPLNIENNAHKTIIFQLIERIDIFGDNYEPVLGYSEKELRGLEGALKGLVSSPCNSKGKGNSKGQSQSQRIVKGKFGEYKHVLLSAEELEKIKAKFPDYLERIKRLDEGIQMKGYKYKDHYLTILKWAEKDPKPQEIKKTDLSHLKKLFPGESECSTK